MLAPAVMQTLSSILNMLPIAYMIRIDTSDAKVYQLSGTGSSSARVVSSSGENEAGGWRFQSGLP
jgi:hypothetical protein